MNNIQLERWYTLNHMQRRVAVAWWHYGYKWGTHKTSCLNGSACHKLYERALYKGFEHTDESIYDIWNNDLHTFLFSQYEGIFVKQDKVELMIATWRTKIHPNAPLDHPFKRGSIWEYLLDIREPFIQEGELNHLNGYIIDIFDDYYMNSCVG